MKRTLSRLLPGLGIAALLPGLLRCGSERAGADDAGRDAPIDVSAPDTRAPDTSVPDTNVPDTRVFDASVPDASEAGRVDGGDAGDAGGVTIKQMALGGPSCALLSNGAVKCWGRNTYGELGDGTTINRLTPGLVIGLAGPAVALTAGQDGACALLSDGGVQCWGLHVGDGTGMSRSTPVSVINLGGAAVALGGGIFHTCAVLSDGTVKCWGDNRNGQLGDGTTINRLSPVSVVGLGGPVKDIAGGSYSTCALLSGGALECWGANTYGELGDGTTTSRPAPAAVAGLGATPAAVSATHFHACSLSSSGAVQCWGHNANGQIGDGTLTRRLSPVSVVNLAGAALSVAAGGDHTCALLSGGAVQCWGYNYHGQIGDGTNTTRTRPVSVPALGGNVDGIFTGNFFTCAVLGGGASAKCWGRNDNGQLGDGTLTFRNVPVSVLSLP